MIRTPATRSASGNARQATVDGRRQRSARNRQAVVSALLAIIREQDGGPVPGAAEIAERAGVSERTVFRHFADLDTLFLAAAAEQRPVINSYVSQRPADKELDKRVSEIARLRSKMYGEIGAVRRVAVRGAVRHVSLAKMIEDANRAARHQLGLFFGPELAKAGKDKSVLLDELDIITSWSSWETLRGRLECSSERSKRIMGDLLTAVLSPYGPRKRSH